MDKKTAERRAIKYIEFMKTLKRNLVEDEFKFDYIGTVEDADLMWYYIDLHK